MMTLLILVMRAYGSKLSVIQHVVFFELHNYIKLLFNCNKTVVFHCDNIGRPNSCDINIEME